MSSVVRLAPTVSLNDEFAEFDIREELERQLEERLTSADLDARALRTFEPVADDDQLSLIRHRWRNNSARSSGPSGRTRTVLNRVLHPVRNGMNPLRLLCPKFDRH